MSSVTDTDIINKFREMVSNRYAYNDLKDRFDLPSKINESIILEIKAYFLESIYPEAAKRKELEDAFAGLGSYVKSPRKIWGLLGNMSKAIFKFGRQFPPHLKQNEWPGCFLGAKNLRQKWLVNLTI